MIRSLLNFIAYTTIAIAFIAGCVFLAAAVVAYFQGITGCIACIF
jgi:hypothetical protein